MNLHQMVRAAITTVNPDLLGTWLKSAGAGVGPSFKQIPKFVAYTAIPMQVQALRANALMHRDFAGAAAYLNMESVTRRVWMYGSAEGVVRPDAKGGDLLIFPQGPGLPAQAWKVFAVVETWPDWCSVAVVLQEGSSVQWTADSVTVTSDSGTFTADAA